jgi:hypothetical protein
MKKYDIRKRCSGTPASQSSVGKENFSKIFFFSYSIFVVKEDNMCKEEILFSTLLAFDLYFVTMHKQKQYYLCAEGSLFT